MSRSPLDHARHNARTCKYLDKDGDFNDWVVTTAFYSALHYVEAAIFPLTVQGDTYQSFDEYCSEKPSSDGKHKRRSSLVYKHLITVHGDYDWLKNESWTARYNSYQTSDRLKEKALSCLDSIIGVCDPDKSQAPSILDSGT